MTVFNTKYQTLYGMQLDDWTKSWGGVSYNTYLTEQSDYFNGNLNNTATTDADDIRFLYPKAPSNTYYLDGLLEGFFTVYNADGGSTATFTSYTAYLKYTEDASDSEVTIESFANTVSDSIGTTSYGVYPIMMFLEHEEIPKATRLLLHINIVHSGGDLEFSHANDDTNHDLMVRIPFF